MTPLRLAYFSPLPPQRTGIADYSAALLPYLGELAQVTAFVDDAQCLQAPPPGVRAMYPLSEFDTRRWQFDLALYQIGNSRFHESIYLHLQHFPGVVVLHDFYLHHLIAGMTAWRGDFAGYAREMGYALGPVGVQLARAARSGQRSYALFEYPLNERVLDCSLGVIVHSQYAAREVRLKRPPLPVVTVAHLMSLPAPERNVRERQRVPMDAFIVACAGQVTVEKRIELILRAIARAREHVPGLRFLLVGDVPEWYPTDLGDLIRQLDLDDVVIRTGHVAELEQLDAYIAAADVCVNLRYPTIGETSGSVLRVMAAGRPVIVSHDGWYAELPDSACIKLKHGADDELALAQQLIDLADDRSRGEAIGRQARAYVERECAPERAAQAYLDFARQVMAGIRNEETRKVR